MIFVADINAAVGVQSLLSSRNYLAENVGEGRKILGVYYFTEIHSPVFFA